MPAHFRFGLDELVEEALHALSVGGTDRHPLHEGRVVAVTASPNQGSASNMAMGISALPPSYSTPPHSHAAEEFALVVRGTGTITIDGRDIPVSPGSIVVTPPDSTHVTTSDSEEPMVIYWVYGPAGSEQRWLSK